MRSVARVIIGLLVIQPSWLTAENKATPSLDVLVAQIPTKRPASGNGISQEQTELAKQIWAHGAEAVPSMLNLLSSENEDVRAFAGYVVRDLDGLTEQNLDTLIAAVKRGNGWVPPAIARIGSPRAVRFLLDEFKAKPEFGTQITWALALCGEKVLPDLLEFVRTAVPPRLGDFDAIEEILTKERGAGVAAVPGLRAIVRDEKLPMQNRSWAIYILGSIGPGAAESVPDLKQVAIANPAAFSNDVNYALRKIGTSDAVPELLRSLRAAPNGSALRDIAALGPNGHDAGAHILPYLGNENWDVRVSAARALGHIGYQEAASQLIALLENPDDWRLVYAAAESLGRLKEQNAAPALERVAENHWFPPVRMAAAKSLRSIAGQDVYKPRRAPAEFWDVLRDYSNEGDSSKIEGPKLLPDFVGEPDVLAKSQLKRMSYEVAEVSAVTNAPPQAGLVKVVPDLGVRFGDTCLLGSDVGEFGGELAYRDARGLTWTLVRSNVHGIHQMPFGTLVTTGLAHLGSNTGTTWIGQMKPGGAPAFKQFKVLPGAPRRSGILKSGDLYIECNGGNVIITPTGMIRMADKNQGGTN